MDLAHSPRVQGLIDQLEAFMDREILPRARIWREAALEGQYPDFIREDSEHFNSHKRSMSSIFEKLKQDVIF